METIYSVVSEAESEIVARAGRIIRQGGLVAFPTETVYGLGGDAFNPRSAAGIYAAKGRPSDNPLIVHISQLSDLDRVSDKVPDDARRLAERFWPGPLTIIMYKKDSLPDETTGGLNTVAVRMPDHPVALALIRESGTLIAAPSANLSGRPSPTTGEHVRKDLYGRIDMILDGGKVGIGLESTIVDLTGEVPCLLRPGYVSYEDLVSVLGRVDIDPAVTGSLKEGERPRAPGMKYRHYAPAGELLIVKGEPSAVTAKINELVEGHLEKGESVGVIATAENAAAYKGNVKCIGDIRNEDEIAANLFALLRAFDDEGTRYIYSEELYTPRLGMAVMNRLIKAAGHRILEV